MLPNFSHLSTPPASYIPPHRRTQTEQPSTPDSTVLPVNPRRRRRPNTPQPDQQPFQPDQQPFQPDRPTQTDLRGGTVYLFCDVATDPKLLVVCEKWRKSRSGTPQWGPPGGGFEASKGDTNEWQSAVREFREEVTVDWNQITTATNCFTWLRVEGGKGGGSRWALLVNQTMENVSNSLRLFDPATGITNETCGVDWIRCAQVLPVEEFNPEERTVTLLTRGTEAHLRRHYAKDTQSMIKDVVAILANRPLFCDNQTVPMIN